MNILDPMVGTFSAILFCQNDTVCTRERLLLCGWIYSIVVFFQSLLFAAPYGKFLKQGSNSVPDAFLNFQMNARLGWMLQEIPAAILGLTAMIAKFLENDMRTVCLLLPFTIHYVNRAVIFPLRLKSGKPVPLLTVAMAFQFCLCNGMLQYLYIDEKYPHWLLNAPFTGYAGLAIFVTGFCINIHSDSILTNLRKPGEKGYKVPYGGMFSFVSAPNYLGEILEWWGWFLYNPNPGSFWFACFTSIFLGTRAFKTHSFYRAKFEDYPMERKALIPYLF
eukprot:TRINITY_DN3241_c0_g1_i1.p1 TRINITY_DN3241_c0_g1~~TRINITY_DN3241_c0_g1_i1.p1  ORF type:complete len:277 (-),score=17.53 TRINITY_DN3241_c0_g1_i1:307-1137(-)